MSEGFGLDNVGLFVRDGILSAEWTTVLDVLLVALILYSVYLIIKQTRAIRILYGILLVVLLYLIGRTFNLVALNFLLQSVFTVMLVAIPVVFQPELRAALERLGRGELVATIFSRSKERLDFVVTELTRTLTTLVTKKVGALIVLERQTGLKDLAATGIPLDAKLSTETLLTIFTPKTPLHDGAVIVRGTRIVAAAVFLPLSSDELDVQYGTRHRAALGLSQESDAAVFVVSEETGRISIVQHGKIETIEPSKLERRLRAVLASMTHRGA
ncbi:TIGR00159 family protein [Candidatus Berkelbacteria bacterium]|nr:TIGR00159 family protein [Candidatus Berkelbacteria bacterium]